jgi:hypothetical protein
MRKRTAVLAAVAAVAAVALALPTGGSSAPPDYSGDAKGPRCSDIFVTASLANSGGVVGQPATVQWTLTTPLAPSCPGGVYTVTVFDEIGSTVLGGGRYVGDGENAAFAGFFSVASAPTAVCVSATSVVRGRITDSAPDSGCERVPLSDVGGASGMG